MFVSRLSIHKLGGDDEHCMMDAHRLDIDILTVCREVTHIQCMRRPNVGSTTIKFIHHRINNIDVIIIQ